MFQLLFLNPTHRSDRWNSDAGDALDTFVRLFTRWEIVSANGAQRGGSRDPRPVSGGASRPLLSPPTLSTEMTTCDWPAWTATVLRAVKDGGCFPSASVRPPHVSSAIISLQPGSGLQFPRLLLLLLLFSSCWVPVWNPPPEPGVRQFPLFQRWHVKNNNGRVELKNVLSGRTDRPSSSSLLAEDDHLWPRSPVHQVFLRPDTPHGWGRLLSVLQSQPGSCQG